MHLASQVWELKKDTLVLGEPLDMKVSIFTIWASGHSPNWNKQRGRTFIRLFTFSRLNDHRPSQKLNSAHFVDADDDTDHY